MCARAVIVDSVVIESIGINKKASSTYHEKCIKYLFNLKFIFNKHQIKQNILMDETSTE